MQKNTYGKAGEIIATNYLKEKNYRIIATNYKNKIGEIDIVAKDGNYIVFIEVKARESKGFGHPLEAVNMQKQFKIRQVAELFLISKKLTKCLCRFDVISILGFENPEIEHIENAF